ncbi:LacI family DNA-binding transcriptional regulator [Actinomyces wuliandei]|uniref:LacI family DNA-binding transcriptional regulator n=1 Tax=Actinomyces wuliandei TaxID=2057743 RepID=UPI0019D43512|nr:LacI family DNA-binding transcriptional regulator [Actinomyces wuliandei]
MSEDSVLLRSAAAAGGHRSRPTMKQVARLAGVGVKTVSRVVNGEPNVAEDTARRVWDAVQELDYHVDVRAGSLRRPGGATRTIALLVASVDNPFAGELHRGVEDVARERDVAVLASSLDEEPQREVAAVEDSIRRHVDGIIVNTTTVDGAALERVLHLGVPIVFVDRAPQTVTADCVTSDTVAAAERATRHLLDQGHRRIVLLTERLNVATALERRQGFLEAFRGTRTEESGALVVSGLVGAEAADRALTDTMTSPDPPTAVFSGQNLLTEGALHALGRLGLRGAVAHIGFDDLPLADMLEPALTVVRQDPRTMGGLAARRLFSRLDGDRGAPERLLVPTELVCRGSGEIPPPGT